MPSHFPDPRIVGTAAFGLPGPLQGTTTLSAGEQERQVRALMNDIFRASLPDSDPLFLPMDPTTLESHSALLEAWAFYVPDLVTSVADSLRTDFGFDPTVASPNFPVDAVLAAALNQILSTAEQRSEVVRSDTETQTSVEREGTTIRERTTERGVTRFIDLPTPEEFMNDFQVGLVSFTQGLRNAGTITQTAADFIVNNPDFFYERYLADLSVRAARGEEIFQVVGVEGEPVFIGERAAGTEEIETTGIDRERVLQRVITDERTQIEEEVIRDLTSTGTVETTEQQQQIDLEIDRRITERTNTLINEAIQFFGTETIITTEQIFSRPRLARVFKVSPASFLGSEFSSQSIENLVAGRRGTRRAESETERGIAPSAPRRAGGS